MKNFVRILLISLALVMALSPIVGAIEPYTTYTYAKDGTPRQSPTVYAPVRNVDSAYMGLETPLSDPRDIHVDENGNVYIVDMGNDRVVVLDQNYAVKFIIKDFVNNNGVPDEFTNPQGIFVDDENIYVCDTDANRLVIFDLEGNFERILGRPTSALFGEDSIYKPIAVAVDQYDRIFVISSSNYQGVIVLTEDGQFTGFIGAQAVTYDAWDIIWRAFQTEEQRKNSARNIPTEYNNITVDEDGFIFVTSSNITAANQYSQLRSKSDKYSPVRKLNAAGDEIMKRLGYFSPSGEVNVTRDNLSRIVDVAVGPEKTWSIIDDKRQKVYTYDDNGNLLFAFGDAGSQLGNLTNIEAITYQNVLTDDVEEREIDGEIIYEPVYEYYMLLLDKSDNLFTVYKRTEYGDSLVQALAYENDREFDLAIDQWKEVLTRNSNFDLAYIGIGRSYYNAGEYDEAMEYYKAAYDTSNYSNAFKEVRKQWIEDHFIWIPIVIIAFVFLWGKFSKYYKKKNKDTALKVGKKTYWEELLYAFHLIFHPFDGFWDLKHEKRGSVRAATTILGIAIVAFYYNSIGRGYIMNPTNEYSTIFNQAVSLVLPLALWVVANWCLTTLFEGEGSLKDVYVASCYSLFPLVLTLIPATLASNVVLADETGIINMLVTIGYIWTLGLIFFGSQTTHDYTMGKNLIMTVASILGMAIVMFIGILFTSLIGNMVSFVTNIIVELQYRF
ncbi:MAG: YIP1 family protein [Clostridia bacterium]|nr:YIP1 family protein [Clostridia bacterium]